MSVYVVTFRAESKPLRVDSNIFTVHAYRYLCRLGELDDHFGERKRRAALMQSHVDRASALFDEHAPQYAAHVYENDWEGATVYTDLKGPIWYDCDVFPGRIVGFLTRVGRSWTITQRKAEVRRQHVAGTQVERHLVHVVADGKHTEETLHWIVLNGDLPPSCPFPDAQFQIWRAQAETQYLQWCADQQAARERVEAEAARQRAIDAKEDEIHEETQRSIQRLAQLQQERDALKANTL